MIDLQKLLDILTRYEVYETLESWGCKSWSIRLRKDEPSR
jgi:hypothetical protein